MMDYEKSAVEAVGYTSVLVVFSMFLHLCMFCLYKIRLFLYDSACCRVVCCLSAEEASESEEEAPGQEKDSFVPMVVVTTAEEEPAPPKSLLNMHVSEV
jgi:hypothetical protein